ncbi:hypothetical protein LLG39_05710, partial [bacterium]|nr:hypothetical protein [bacterium]
TIIPIATVCTGFGFGGGEGKQARENEPAQEGTGGGGGGGMRTKPLAVLEVTDEETKLIPVIDVTRVVLASLMFAGMATCMITRLLSHGRNK